jgi:hypothetical protein
METCNNNNGIAPGVKIFGAIFPNNVSVGDPIPMKKSASMGNLSSQNFIDNDNEVATAGYVSDGIGKATHERKKGMYIYIYFRLMYVFVSVSMSYVF